MDFMEQFNCQQQFSKEQIFITFRTVTFYYQSFTNFKKGKQSFKKENFYWNKYTKGTNKV